MPVYLNRNFIYFAYIRKIYNKEMINGHEVEIAECILECSKQTGRSLKIRYWSLASKIPVKLSTTPFMWGHFPVPLFNISLKLIAKNV